VKTALVTGATGGLGRALTTALHHHGWSVRGLARSGPTSGDSFVAADIATVDWELVLGDCEVVFHLAAFVHRRVATQSDREAVYALNEQATRRLADSCRRRKVPLIFASSVAVFSAGTSADGAVSDYAVSKRRAEEAIERQGQMGLGFTIVRLPLLYGPGGRGNMERMLRAIYRRRYWPVVGDDIRKSCLFLDDAATALIRAQPLAAAGRNETHVASSQSAATLSEIHRHAYRAVHQSSVPRPAIPVRYALSTAAAADQLAGAFGRRTQLLKSMQALTAPAEFDGSVFARAAGFEPRISLQTGIERTARWIRTTSTQ
jgi:UDP-glucose 4-epimerase